MKKIIFAFFLIFACCVCNAQKFNYGVEIGYLNNRLAVDEYRSKAKSGFLAGALVEMDIINVISIESGLSFVRRAGEITGDNILGTKISKIKYSQLDYLRIPLTVGYKFNIHDFSIRPAVGGYYAVGIHGDSFISSVDDYGQPFESRISTFSNSRDYPYRPCNRNDAGLLFSLNAKYKHFGINLSYDLGLTTTSYYGNGKNRSFIVSLAYWLK